MTIEEIYKKYKNKSIKCICNDKDGNLVEGYGIVCGYKESWLVLGFNTDYEGCITNFTKFVKYSPIFKSYRFWNIKYLEEYNITKSAQHPTSEGENVR